MFKMLNKKAYLRTLEAFMAVFITFVFVIYILPAYVTDDKLTESINLLTPLADELRDCNNVSCVESSIANFDPDFVKKYDYIINISSDPNVIVEGLPKKNIYTDSVYIVGNITNYEPRIIRIYYWER